MQSMIFISHAIMLEGPVKVQCTAAWGGGELPPTPCGYLDVQVSVSWQAFLLTLMCCLDSEWVFCTDWQLWRHHPATESGQESERPVGRGSCRTNCWGGCQCGPPGRGAEPIPPWGLATGEQRQTALWARAVGRGSPRVMLFTLWGDEAQPERSCQAPLMKRFLPGL